MDGRSEANERFERVYPKSLNSDGRRGIVANLFMLIFGLGGLASLGWGIWLTVTAHSLLFSLSVFAMAATALSTFLVNLFVTGDQGGFRTRHPNWSRFFAISTIAITFVTMAALMVLGAPVGGAFFGALAVGGVNFYALHRSGSSADQFNTPILVSDSRAYNDELSQEIRDRNILEGALEARPTFNQYNEVVDRFPEMAKGEVIEILRKELTADRQKLETKQKADEQKLAEAIGHFAPHSVPKTANSSDTDDEHASLLTSASQSSDSSAVSSTSGQPHKRGGMHPSSSGEE